MVKIKDVAKVAGVSAATESRALANKLNVRAEVKQHVLNVAEKLNYQPNVAAQNLRANTSKIIALIAADID